MPQLESFKQIPSNVSKWSISPHSGDLSVKQPGSLSYTECDYIFWSQESIDYSNQIQAFPKAFLAQEKTVADLKTTVENFSTCLENDLSRFENSGYYFSILGALYHIRLKVRAQVILEKINQGMDVLTVFAPYAISEETGRYLDFNLFFQAEKSYSANFFAAATQYLIKLQKTGKLRNKRVDRDRYNSLTPYIAETLNCNKEMILFINLIKKTAEYEDLALPELVTLLIKNNLSGWQALVKNYLTDPAFEIEMKQANCDEYFLIAMTDLAVLNTILIDPRAAEKYLELTNFNSFFATLKKLTLSENDALAGTKLDKFTDYWQALLLLGFNYHLLIDPLLNNFNQYRKEITLVLYEALLRGDQTIAKKILATQDKHQEKQFQEERKTPVYQTNLTLFHTETIEYTNTVNHSIKDFCNYIAQKYHMLDNKSDCYFIKYINDFIIDLKNLNIIKDADAFKTLLCKQFHLTPTSNENLLNQIADLKVEQQAMSTTNKKLIAEINELKAQIASMQKSSQNTLFKLGSP